MKRFAILCALVLSVALLSGCMPAVVITSPRDEEFQRDWADSIDESAEDWAEDFEDAWDGFWNDQDEEGVEKDHYWRILDAEGQELGTVTDPEQVDAIDDLLSTDSHQGTRMAEDPGDPAYSYVYCQQETLKAGQKEEEDRAYEELVRFTVSESEDVMTMVILEDLPSLLNVDLGELLTFTFTVPAGTAEALRDPGQFLE